MVVWQPCRTTRFQAHSRFGPGTKKEHRDRKPAENSRMARFGAGLRSAIDDSEILLDLVAPVPGSPGTVRGLFTPAGVAQKSLTRPLRSQSP